MLRASGNGSSPDRSDVPVCGNIGDEFEIQNLLGKGSYGEVYKAKSKQSREVVAIKVLKVDALHETSQAEVQALLELNSHENIVRLRRVGLNADGDSGQCLLFLVLEYCQHGLRTVIQTIELSPGQIKDLTRQLFRGVAEIHRNNFLHRDIKPENVLIDAGGVLKIVDFGLSVKEDPSRVRLGEYSNEVVSFWYKSPELLVGSRSYGSPVDVWSAGCTAAELWLGGPLFCTFDGEEEEQLTRIVQLCGSDGVESCFDDPLEVPRWREALGSPPVQRSLRASLRTTIGDANFLDLLDRILQVEPSARLSAREVLDHRYFLCPPDAESVADVLRRLGSGRVRRDQATGPEWFNKLGSVNRLLRGVQREPFSCDWASPCVIQRSTV